MNQASENSGLKLSKPILAEKAVKGQPYIWVFSKMDKTLEIGTLKKYCSIGMVHLNRNVVADLDQVELRENGIALVGDRRIKMSRRAMKNIINKLIN